MSITRIDFQGQLARTNDFSQLKQHEDDKVLTDHNALQEEVDKKADQKTTTVVNKDNADQNQHERHDAKEKGKNEYMGNGGAKKKKQSLEELEKLSESLIGEDGRPLNMHISSGFDFKI